MAAPLAVPRRPGFEPNRGRWPAAVQFAARDGGTAVFLTATEVVWDLPGAAAMSRHVHMRWLGGNRQPEIVAGDPTGARVHRYRGRDAAAWQTDVPLYGRATYRDVYPGIDLILHDERGALEYDFVVAPGADPSRIRLVFEGVPPPAVDAAGALRFGSNVGILHRAPVVYQRIDGTTVPIGGRYVVTPHRGAAAAATVAFALGTYDATRPLVIDPQVTCTASVEDMGIDTVVDAAVDRDGNVWLVGTTTSHEFPITDDAPDDTFPATEFDEGYVLELGAHGTLRYATYLGGSNVDGAAGIAIGPDGSVYVAGTTISTDVPIAGDAYSTELASPGAEDAFLVRLDATGRMLTSTYFGGNGRDLFPGGVRGNPGVAVAVTSAGTVYLAGGTGSTDLPTTDGYQPGYGRRNTGRVSGQVLRHASLRALHVSGRRQQRRRLPHRARRRQQRLSDGRGHPSLR